MNLTISNKLYALHGLRRLLLAAACALPGTAYVVGQVANVDAATLGKYDKNLNGRLDPNELAAMQADEAKAARTPVGSESGAKSGDDIVELSPFEVKEVNNGYYAANTMSGTRLNAKIEDLASSISVVTKQQMSDFAMLDLNDIFNYEAGTEGTGNYTDHVINGNGMVIDNIQDNPQGANRIRGIGAANIALNNYGTSGRVPIDPIDLESVEISRGPNSNIFGLGGGAGTVNLIGASAALNKDATTVAMRMDSLGGYRGSLVLNRSIVRNKVALRASMVYQDDAFNQKPSGTTTRRYSFMLRAQPFKNTSVRASFQDYKFHGTRPNTVTPRDTISYWKSLGSPTWDPTTSTVTVNGVSTVTGAANPNGLSTPPAFSMPVVFVDRNGIALWEIQRTPAANAINGPNNVSGATRLLETVAEPVRINHPLYGTWPGVTDKSIFDWSSINLASMNSIRDHTETTTVEVEHFFLNSERQQLAVQLGWNHEYSTRFNRNVFGRGTAGTGNADFLFVDPNSKLLDGRPNPYFLRPYLGVGQPTHSDSPYRRDTYRGQLAYKLDFTNASNWRKWLGRHSLLGYGEERATKTQSYVYRDVNITDHPIYAPAGQSKANLAGVVAPLATRPYFHFYVGDNNGQNVDYGPSTYSVGNYLFNWYNPVTQRWVADPVTLGQAATSDTTNTANAKNLIKTQGVVLQSSLLQNRVVFTGGLRRDENYNLYQKQPVLNADGYTLNYAAFADYVGDWAVREGDTLTEGIVARPFRGWPSLDRAASRSGAVGFFAGVLRGLNVHYNKSDSFLPSSSAMSLFMEQLPNPSSNGKDYGFALNLWDGKMVLRANRYVTDQIDNRGDAFLSARTLRQDIVTISNDAYSLQRQARNWVSAANPSFNTQQVDAAVYQIMGLSPDQVAAFNTNVIGDTKNQTARGDEFELYYNPDHFWTLKLNVTRQQSSDGSIDPNVFKWIDERMPFWTSIIDPRNGRLWWTNGYTGENISATAASANSEFIRTISAPAQIARATEGKSRPQIREWRYNLSGSVRLARYTEHRFLKKVSVGGSLRWESKGAIGYYGIPVNGDIAQATQFDPNRPIYTKANTYVDAFVTYNTRFLHDKVRARFQLNARNLQEWKARLVPVTAFPDGSPSSFRIIDPMTFILTCTFDL